MKNDLAAGIKNAMEKGESLEIAKKTFLNAGYNSQEVDEAVKIVSSGVSDIVYQTELPKGSKQQSNQTARVVLPELPPTKKKTEKSKIFIIALIILNAVILLGAVGYLIYILG